MAVPAARRALKAFGARGLVCAGGYASMPGALAASLMRLPVVALESNAVPGKVTRAVSRMASVCFSHMPLTMRLNCPVEVLGNPVRQAFLNAVGTAEARQALGLDPRRPTLLVMGGSQGAHGINEAAFAAAESLAAWRDKLNLLHITGPADAERAEHTWKQAGISFRSAPFTHNTATWLAASDIALTRAGAASIAELQVCGVFALLVPYPHAADDHQRANAQRVAASGAGVVVPQESLTAARLCELVQRLLLNEPARSAAREAALASAKPRAGSDILHGILREFGISETPAVADSRRRAA
jgi:UDP-N-acetylglucosamine--N-acetylmuramyl-(pentapeptide) pyrophosphoryl-undecaprenol N-acetylglucosamine transferase